MNLRILSLAMFLVCISPQYLTAGFTTPNTGADWTLDSLVAYSGGTLTGSFPNYTLNDTLTIAQNDRVTFRAGSVISVAQGTGKGFTVFGTLRAVGTPTDTIVVKGVVSTAGSHRGFRFEDPSVDSACVLSYCRIQDAVDAVYCLYANTLITHSLFTDNSSNGVRCFNASPTVSFCTFVENRQSCITANVNSSPLIEHNLFARNNSQNTGARNQIAIGGQGSNNPIIRDNEIYNQSYFRAGGISLATLTSTDVCNAIVENNYIHDNSFGIVVQGLSAGGTLHPIIRYNRIENNRINPDSMNSGSGIAVYTGGPSNSPIITGNLIKGNYWGITCVSASGLTSSPKPDLGNLTNADTSDDGWNVFDNNGNGGVIYQLYNNGTQDISAQNNFWGSTDSATVERWIVHRPDSAVFGMVNYLPFISPEMGHADSFVVRRISQTELQLRWGYPLRFMPDTLRLEYRLGPPIYVPLVVLPGTETSFLWTPPVAPFVVFRLIATNRFGTVADTVLFDLTSVAGFGQQPPGFVLEQNYPNPFNPGTTIPYQIAVRAHVVITVFDVLGREVAVLRNGIEEPGRKSVQWNPGGLASGVYFYRLAAGGYVATQKLLLTR